MQRNSYSWPSCTLRPVTNTNTRPRNVHNTYTSSRDRVRSFVRSFVCRAINTRDKSLKPFPAANHRGCDAKHNSLSKEAVTMEEVCERERHREREKERSRTIEIVTPAARARTILCNGSNPEAEARLAGERTG